MKQAKSKQFKCVIYIYICILNYSPYKYIIFTLNKLIGCENNFNRKMYCFILQNKFADLNYIS